MSIEELKRSITLNAPSTAFSVSQYRMVQQSSSENVFVAGTSVGADTINVGVLQDAPTIAGEASEIATFGSVTKMVVGSTALIPGVNYVSGALGKAITTGTVGAGQVIYGPWMSAGQSTDSIGFAMFNIVGMTT